MKNDNKTVFMETVDRSVKVVLRSRVVSAQKPNWKEEMEKILQPTNG